MNKHNDGQTETHEDSPFVKPAPQGVDHGRRHFTRAGLVVSGAILTLNSAPVLAGRPTGNPTNINYAACESPSGFASMNVSAPGKTPITCGGLSPGGWKNWPTYWPEGFEPGACLDSNGSGCSSFNPNTGTPFHSGVSGSLTPPRPYPGSFPGFSGNVFDKLSLMGVMNLEGNADPAKLGMHCAASILNVAKGLVPTTVLTIPVIMDMWASTSGGGYYEPSVGVKWYSADVVTYLKSTFG